MMRVIIKISKMIFKSHFINVGAEINFKFFNKFY